MGRKVRDLMTPNPLTLEKTSTIAEAAGAMKSKDIGDVLIMDNGKLCGILTDRDIVIRAIADQRDPTSTKVGDVASTGQLHVLSPDDDSDKAVKMARDHAIRRFPVVENGKPVGVVSMGDLAVEKDPNSALASVSAAPPNE